MQNLDSVSRFVEPHAGAAKPGSSPSRDFSKSTTYFTRYEGCSFADHAGVPPHRFRCYLLPITPAMRGHSLQGLIHRPKLLAHKDFLQILSTISCK